MHLLPILWLARRPVVSGVRTVLAALIPNMFLLLVIIANMMWWREGGGTLGMYREVSATFPWAENLWQESMLLVGTVLAVDVAVIYFFARGWRNRRWGRKPAEVEAATKYFNI